MTDDAPPRNFGEEGARLSYASYLRLEPLLRQQVLASEPPAHDELLFITIHQVYELWFKLLLHELAGARDAMFADELWRAAHMLGRAAEIERVLIKQVDVLDTMTPQDFLAFRSLLAPASGFQSVQFRELEFLSGAKDPQFVARFHALTEPERAALEARLAEPSLWDAFVDVLRQQGLAVGDEAEVRESLLLIARDPAKYGQVWELSEALLSHDANAANWRFRHVTTVERLIGAKSGTGGSSGGPYLRSRLGLRYFPLLWESRSYL